MNDFIIELPNFSYDKLALFEYQQKNIEWAANVHYKSGGIDTASMGFYDHYPTTDCGGLLLTILKNINLSLNFNDFKFNKLSHNGKMPFHIDPQRSAVLMLPLTTDPAKIEWQDTDGNVLYEHTYKCPTIINAQILHGVPFSNNERIFLQVRIHEEWHIIQENYKTMFSFS
jgi:hypothetical protein